MNHKFMRTSLDKNKCLVCGRPPNDHIDRGEDEERGLYHTEKRGIVELRWFKGVLQYRQCKDSNDPHWTDWTSVIEISTGYIKCVDNQ